MSPFLRESKKEYLSLNNANSTASSSSLLFGTKSAFAYISPTGFLVNFFISSYDLPIASIICFFERFPASGEGYAGGNPDFTLK